MKNVDVVRWTLIKLSVQIILASMTSADEDNEDLQVQIFQADANWRSVVPLSEVRSSESFGAVASRSSLTESSRFQMLAFNLELRKVENFQKGKVVPLHETDPYVIANPKWRARDRAESYPSCLMKGDIHNGRNLIGRYRERQQEGGRDPQEGVDAQ